MKEGIFEQHYSKAVAELDADLTPELGRSPGGGQGYPLQYSCLENPMDRGATIRGIPKQLDMTERLTLPQAAIIAGNLYCAGRHDDFHIK